MSSCDPLPSDQERELYFEGIRLFNAQEFFEAHEVWEEIWQMAFEPKHSFYQGLIQSAVALEHYRRSNPRGVLSLSRSYVRKFQGLPGRFMGLDVPAFLTAMNEALAPVIHADPLPQRGEISLEPERAPTIELEYDPFETGEAQRLDRPARPD